ncbi:MAG: 30S ribosomal protein S8 [Actinobacteria bacterium]|nr:30S ribosomal protein S8 [Actinomycetota bacterium]
MGMTDPIADMLTRLRNANTAYKDYVDVPASKIKLEIAKILKEEGYIKDFKITKGFGVNTIRITMNYGPFRERVIGGLKRISRPGLKVYARKDEIPRVLGGLGIAILSTSKGVVTAKEARSLGLGGEVICYVW